jgi:glycosyltransferase involved in cell wall biosynthesis
MADRATSISVLTVVRNGAPTIAENLRSVASQTYPHVEHVVQDGASTDATAQIVATLATERVHLESRADGGIYAGFNNAIARATGEVVGFLNGDDVYQSPEVLSNIADCFRDPSIDLVFGDVVYVDPQRTSRIVRYYSSRGFRPALLARGYIPAHPTLFVRRGLFDEVGLFNPSYRIAGDFEWIARLFQRASPRYRYLEQALVRMRLGGVSSSGWRATLLVTREIKRACAENGIETSYLRLMSRFPSKLLERFRT